MENIGGMQRVAVDLHDGLLAHRDIEASAVVLRSSWSERSYRTPLFLARALRVIRRRARAREIDAVLFSSMVTAALAIPLRNVLRRNGIVTAAIVNGLDATTPTWPYPALVRSTFGAIDIALPISQATADACSTRGLAPGKCSVVPLGVKLDRFAARTDRLHARAKLLHRAGRTQATPRLVLSSVGRLVPRKGVAWFVSNVMPLLPHDVQYVVAGEGPDRVRIAAAIRQNELSDRVTLLGAITDSELEDVYYGSDLFVMPNVHVANDLEGFGLVMLEAGLCGLPTVASRIDGIADVVTEEENGFLVETEDVRGFRDAIMRFHFYAGELESASERARLHTIAHFGWATVIDRYIEVIERGRAS